jgi:Uma2 family endonuclease
MRPPGLSRRHEGSGWFPGPSFACRKECRREYTFGKRRLGCLVQKTEKSSTPPAEQRIVLDGISWETYESLLADHEGKSAPRFAYDRGKMEIMSPSPEHEMLNRRIASLIMTIMEEMDFDAEDFGSTTFRREDVERGSEPDTCFYMEGNAERMRGKKRLDLSTDPPPDIVLDNIVLEIDITSPSINKFPIYARLGVPEVWRYEGKKLEIFRLADGEYKAVPESPALSGFTSGELSKLIEEGKPMKRFEWIKRVREAARKKAR